jgi:uncharacterized membrane protein (UPF0127 family)
LAFRRAQIRLKGEVIIADVADSPELIAHGLSGRPHLDDHRGMLFVFERPGFLVFWMKNVAIPLSIGFFDGTGHLINVEEMAVEDADCRVFPRYESQAPAQYALEMRANWFDDYKIRPPARLDGFCDWGVL